MHLTAGPLRHSTQKDGHHNPATSLSLLNNPFVLAIAEHTRANALREP